MVKREYFLCSLSVIGLMLFSTPALSLSCISSGFEREFSRADAIIEAEVIGIDFATDPTRVDLHVKRYWKLWNSQIPTNFVYTANPFTDFPDIAVSKAYIFFLHRAKGDYTIGHCPIIESATVSSSRYNYLKKRRSHNVD